MIAVANCLVARLKVFAAVSMYRSFLNIGFVNIAAQGPS